MSVSQLISEEFIKTIDDERRIRGENLKTFLAEQKEINKQLMRI